MTLPWSQPRRGARAWRQTIQASTMHGGKQAVPMAYARMLSAINRSRDRRVYDTPCAPSDVAGTLGRIQCKTLLVQGHRNPLVDDTDVDVIDGLLVQAPTLVRKYECGHHPYLEMPLVFADDLRRFVRGELDRDLAVRHRVRCRRKKKLFIVPAFGLSVDDYVDLADEVRCIGFEPVTVDVWAACGEGLEAAKDDGAMTRAMTTGLAALVEVLQRTATSEYAVFAHSSGGHLVDRLRIPSTCYGFRRSWAPMSSLVGDHDTILQDIVDDAVLVRGSHFGCVDAESARRYQIRQCEVLGVPVVVEPHVDAIKDICAHLTCVV